MIDKPTRDDLAALLGMVRGRLISLLVIVAVALGIATEGFSIFQSWQQITINSSEIEIKRAKSCSARMKALTNYMSIKDVKQPRPEEVTKLELECSPYRRAEQKEAKTAPLVQQVAGDQIERSACYQNLKRAYPNESDADLRKDVLTLCTDVSVTDSNQLVADTFARSACFLRLRKAFPDVPEDQIRERASKACKDLSAPGQ